MNDNQKTQIKNLRLQGLGYIKISQVMDISVNTIKSYCRRNNLAVGSNKETKVNLNISLCKNCSKELLQNKGKKERSFCNDKCRSTYWRNNQGKINRKTATEYICLVCNKPFIDYARNNRKYCGRECYIKARYGGDVHE